LVCEELGRLFRVLAKCRMHQARERMPVGTHQADSSALRLKKTEFYVFGSVVSILRCQHLLDWSARIDSEYMH
jgi:hypothetical protein